MTTVSPLATKQETAMRKFLAVLNEISVLDVDGFAAVIDTANDFELTQLLSAVEIVQQQIARWRAMPR